MVVIPKKTGYATNHSSMFNVYLSVYSINVSVLLKELEPGDVDCEVADHNSQR